MRNTNGNIGSDESIMGRDIVRKLHKMKYAFQRLRCENWNQIMKYNTLNIVYMVLTSSTMIIFCYLIRLYRPRLAYLFNWMLHYFSCGCDTVCHSRELSLICAFVVIMSTHYDIIHLFFSRLTTYMYWIHTSCRYIGIGIGIVL